MSNAQHKQPRLPTQQLAILAVARFAEPVALTSVFPYLPEMIRSFGVPNNSVAKWAGITSAAFALAQSASAVPWGRASDVLGRKPIVVISLLNGILTFLLWGMASNLPMAIFARILQGAGSGNVGIIRTMVAEMVPDKALQPRAFSIMPLVWSVGSVFGPAFGGFLANPSRQFPWLFGESRFFQRFPFALPNLVLATLFSISCLTAFLFLKETLKTQRNKRDVGREVGQRLIGLVLGRPYRHHHQSIDRYRPHRLQSHIGAHHHVDVDEESGPLLEPISPARSTASTGRWKSSTPAQRSEQKHQRVTIREVLTPQIVLTLLCYTIMALHSVAYDQVLPVFLNYPIQEPTPDNTQLPFYFSGGFGLSANRIGTIFTIYGVTCGLVQFAVFPPACRRWGVLNCYKMCVVLFPIVYAVTPYTSLPRTDAGRAVAVAAVLVLKAVCIIFAFPCATILFTNAAPSQRVLGTLNGLAVTLSGLGRAVGPASAGTIFSWGVARGFVIYPWWYLAAIAILGAVPVWYIVDGPGPSASSAVAGDSDDDDDDDCCEAEENHDDLSIVGNNNSSSISDVGCRRVAATSIPSTAQHDDLLNELRGAVPTQLRISQSGNNTGVQITGHSDGHDLNENVVMPSAVASGAKVVRKRHSGMPLLRPHLPDRTSSYSSLDERTPRK